MRLGVPPREENPVRAPARGYPHAGSTLDRARELIETTPLSYREIARQTGVSIATISRRAKAGAWVRPQTHMPPEHYTPPTAAASSNAANSPAASCSSRPNAGSANSKPTRR